MIRRVWGWWTWQRLLALGAVGLFLLSVSAVTSVITNYADEGNEHANDAADRAVQRQLIRELRCYRQAAAPATAYESEMVLQLAVGLAGLFLDPTPDDDETIARARERAEAIREIAGQLEGVDGDQGAIDARLQAARDCNDGTVDDRPLSPP